MGPKGDPGFPGKIKLFNVFNLFLSVTDTPTLRLVF
jgi:hypothetical protein